MQRPRLPGRTDKRRKLVRRRLADASSPDRRNRPESSDRRSKGTGDVSSDTPPVIPLVLSRLPPPPAELLRLLVTRPRTAVSILTFGARSMGLAIEAFRVNADEKALSLFARGVFPPSRPLTDAQRQRMMDNVLPHKAVLLGRGLPNFTAADARALKVPALVLTSQHAAPFHRPPSPTPGTSCTRTTPGHRPGDPRPCFFNHHRGELSQS